jgi:hypothetical protein
MKKRASTKTGRKATAMVSGYARMWPRAVFYTKALNQQTGRDRNLGKELAFLQRGGVYVLYRDDTPYYIGKAGKLRRRLHMWATKPSSPHFHFWNYFSAFAVNNAQKRNELEGVLIAALPSAANSAKPKLKSAGLPREVKDLLRQAYGGTPTMKK